MSEPEASARTSGMGVSGPVLSARGIVKTFGPVVALEGVDLDLHRGEVLAIIGDNGAGKSTLVKCLTGAEIPDVGEIRVDGKVVKFRKPQDARDAGIETVYQTLSLSPALDIASNLFLGRERVRQDFLGRWLRVLDKRGMCRDAEAKVATLGIRTIQDINQVVETLSGGQRQAVAVARAVAFGGMVIVLDEPTAALGVREARQVLDIVQQLRTRGLGIILISHNMPQVFEVADRIHIQRLGRCAGIITPQTHTMPQAVAIMTGAMSIGDSFLGASAASARGSNSAERQRTMSAPSRRKILSIRIPPSAFRGGRRRRSSCSDARAQRSATGSARRYDSFWQLPASAGRALRRRGSARRRTRGRAHRNRHGRPDERRVAATAAGCLCRRSRTPGPHRAA